MMKAAGLWAVVVLAAVVLLSPSVDASDNFALMVDSLKTFQAHACDGEEIQLKCYNGTVISLNFVQYGRPYGRSNDQCQDSRQDSTILSSKDGSSTNCKAKDAFKVVERKCQEHLKCRFLVSPNTFQEDPCPGVRKYTEIVYKCRPDHFVNKIACENEEMILKCQDHYRIMIFSAFYGSIKIGAMECPETIGLANEICESSQATDEAVYRCLGREQCVLKATDEQFGAPNGCSPFTKKFLKVAFNCVPKEILLPYEDKASHNITYYREGNVFATWIPDQEPSLHSRQHDPESTAGVEMQRDSTSRPGEGAEDRKMLQFFAACLSAHKFMRENKQRLILYLSLSLSVGLMFFVVVVWLNFFLRGTLASQEKKPSNAPVTEDDFFTDSDLEHFGEDFMTSANNTMMRKISEAIPRAPVADGPQTNHFFS